MKKKKDMWPKTHLRYFDIVKILIFIQNAVQLRLDVILFDSFRRIEDVENLGVVQFQ